MKIGEIWKLKHEQTESPLIPVLHGHMLSLDENDKADNFIFIPLKVKIVNMNHPDPPIKGNVIQVIEWPVKNSEKEEYYFFTHKEFVSLYVKDWEPNND